MSNKSGFTLIELLVVIAIIGLLASIVLVSLNSARGKARDTKRIADLKQIQVALEMFYDQYSRYPITAGQTYWDGHWMNFQTCLQTGVGCGFTITGYTPAMIKVPQDPQDSDPNTANNGRTYYYRWGSCSDQGYVLKAILETDNSALDGDSDGNYYSTTDNLCNDSSLYYCIKQNWCY
jgi:prepilin-type N-terminal cleavage/methylation domain-containing protein